jgi:predicted amidohydrolase
MEKITNIGFFHFGREYGNPIEALRCALEARGKAAVKGALIVLPEGFNVGECYHDSTDQRRPEECVIDRLKYLTLEYGVAFVAALVLDLGGKKRNSAYLIDQNEYWLICHKMLQDDFGVYEGWNEGGVEGNPQSFGGIMIGCLICADSDPPQRRSWTEQRPDIERKIAVAFACRADGNISKVLCIPSHSHLMSGKEAPRAWPDHTIVYASSCDKAIRGSSIGHLGRTLAEAEGPTNVVEVVGLQAAVA